MASVGRQELLSKPVAPRLRDLIINDPRASSEAIGPIRLIEPISLILARAIDLSQRQSWLMPRLGYNPLAQSLTETVTVDTHIVVRFFLRQGF